MAAKIRPGFMERALCPVMVGRAAELESLRRALAEARDGHGRLLMVTGEAGVGKSRLVTDLRRHATSLGIDSLWGGCSEAELALPYLPFLEAIGNHLAMVNPEALRGRLAQEDLKMLGTLFPSLRPEGVSAAQGEGLLQLFEALLSLLTALAGKGGLLLVLEELHWADASTRQLVDYLARRLRNLPILIVGTARIDELNRQHPLSALLSSWQYGGPVELVRLEPLSRSDIGEMIRLTLGAQEVLGETSDFFHQRTEGNPFALEEFLRVAIDRGDIFRTGAVPPPLSERGCATVPLTILALE